MPPSCCTPVEPSTCEPESHPGETQPLARSRHLSRDEASDLKRGFWITLLAILAFAVIVIARLPASWVIPSSAANVSCAAVDGSIWNGSCTGLRVGGSPMGDVEWEVHALRL